MKKSNRKGFTIVELVIVIAVIAILAAVLIPTFSNLIKKANESSDVQAVRQMNTILAAENAFVGGITINDAVKALKEAGFNGDKYVPLVSGRYFFYDQDTKQIVYTEYKDGKYNVLFPKDATIEGHALFSLSGDVAKKDYAAPTPDKDGNLVFSISSAEEYAQLAADFKEVLAGKSSEGLAGFTADLLPGSKVKGIVDKDIVIDLTEDIDLKGASFNLNLSGGSFTLNGNGHTISGITNNSGFAMSDNNDENQLSPYGSAFLGYVGNGATITFNNVTFKNCHFGNSEVKGSAVFVGHLDAAGSVTFNETKVENCTVDGKYGVAVYVGHLCGYETHEQTVTFVGKNTVSDCELSATDNRVGNITGRVSGKKATISNSVAEGTVSPSFSGVTIISAGVAVNANGRDIINGGNNGDPAVAYTGSWTK